MISAADYDFLGELLRRNSGHALGSEKGYLVESRLAPVAASLGFRSLGALLFRLRATGDAALARTVCEAMTTNESLFFRDGAPFRYLRERVIPELLATRGETRRLRIWSAAAATGQEPYSVAMLLAEMAPALDGWRVEILATDYSRPALERARAGVYNHFEVQRGLPIQLLTRYFTRRGDDWEIAQRIRDAVTFREANLLDPFAHLGRFDVVFCRNVLIYFDRRTKAGVLDRMHRAVAPNGFLFLGSTESALGICPALERVPDAPASVYRPLAPVEEISLAS